MKPLNALLFLAVVTGLLIFSIHLWAGMPIVYKSWATNDCVEVESFTVESYSCDDLPEKYELVWRK